jgi:hypothetical protein
MAEARVGPAEYWAARITPLALLVMFAGCVGFGIWNDRYLGPPRDEFVRTNAAILTEVSSPEEAESRIKNCGTLRFPNGDWVTGVGVNSHSSKRAKDTMVVRDSRGQVKAYVGHYCGPNWMPGYFPENHPDFSTLDKVYAFLPEWGFKEYSPPEP